MTIQTVIEQYLQRATRATEFYRRKDTIIPVLTPELYMISRLAEQSLAEHPELEAQLQQEYAELDNP